MAFNFNKPKQQSKGLVAASSPFDNSVVPETTVVEEEQQLEASLDEFEDSLEESPDEFQQDFSEAEEKFQQYQYYKTWLEHDWLPDDDSEIGQKTLKEVKDFFRERIASIFGNVVVKPKAQVEEVFTEEELKALKTLVARLLKKPELAQVQQPVIAKAPPVITAPKMKPVTLSKPKQATKKAAPKLKKAEKAPESEPEEFPDQPEAKFTGEVVEVKHQKYAKYVHPQRGEYWLGENGQKYIQGMNGDGEPYMKNVTEPSKPPRGAPQPIPPLTKAQLEAVSQQKAISSTASLQSSVISGNVLSGLGVK